MTKVDDSVIAQQLEEELAYAFAKLQERGEQGNFGNDLHDFNFKESIRYEISKHGQLATANLELEIKPVTNKNAEITLKRGRVLVTKAFKYM